MGPIGRRWPHELGRMDLAGSHARRHRVRHLRLSEAGQAGTPPNLAGRFAFGLATGPQRTSTLWGPFCVCINLLFILEFNKRHTDKLATGV